ncbi:MAG: AAA family ATPase [Candidatus Aenigmatarchaeota archaeon]|jgi:MoxR-like ATPase
MIGYNIKRMNDVLNIAYITSENCIFIGPPGTAKSLLAKSWSEKQNKTFFYYLLNKYTTPDELLGPVSLEEYKKGIFRRITTNKLPECQIAFIDEIFKASTAILNTLLTIMNERIFFNPEPTPVKTEMIISASNEIPTEEELLALYDRFLFRYFTDYVNNDELKLLLEYANSDNTNGIYVIEKREIKELPKLSDSEIGFIMDTILQLKEQGIIISDRRKVKIIKVLRTLKAYDMLNPYYFRLTIETIFPFNQKEKAKVIDYLDKVLPDINTLIRKLNKDIDYILSQRTDSNQKIALLQELLNRVKNEHKGKWEVINAISARIKGEVVKLIEQNQNKE